MSEIKPDLPQLYCDAVNALKIWGEALLDESVYETDKEMRKALIKLAKRVAEAREDLRGAQQSLDYEKQYGGGK